MPRSFLVKKYLKQKYDEDQIKLQALREANGLSNDNTDSSNDHNNENNKNNYNSNNALVSLLTTTNNNNNHHHHSNHSTTRIPPDEFKPHVTAPYTPLVGLTSAGQPLSVKYNNGYIHDVTFIQTGLKTEEATIPKVKDEAAAAVAVTAHDDSSSNSSKHHQPRRSVIVTNANHPANRHLSSHLGHHDVIEPIDSPPIAYTAGEQFMPYDYSLPRSDRPSTAHTPTIPAATPAHQACPSTALTHASNSPNMAAYAPLSSPPPAHHGFEPQSMHPSPRRTPPSQVEFLPADHPFNHPLIQQLINQRLHVPSEKSGEIHQHHLNGKISSFDEDEDRYSLARLPHHQNFSTGSHLQTTSEAPLNDYEMSDARMEANLEQQQEVGGHHHHHHHYTTSSMVMSASSILTSSHLTPIHTHPNFHHTFPPSPSPTIPSSSPTLPYSESKTHFILPPPTPPTPSTIHSSPCHTRLTASPHSPSPAASPASPASSSSSTCSNTSTSIFANGHHDASAMSNDSSNHLNTNKNNNNNNTALANNNNDNNSNISDEDPNAEATPKANAYTYDAFLISDGRSRKRTHEQIESRESGRLRYTCNECGKDYATSSNLSRHKQTHRALDSKNAKKCPHCDKVYVSMPALSMHILTHDLKHACNICGKTFSRPWLLQGHMRSHTGEKPFGCAHCGKAFADRSNLRAHMQTHSAFKHFACSKCNKSFALKSYLNKHLESSCVKE